MRGIFLSFIVGTIGYLLYFIYDLNQIFSIHKSCKSFFSIGSIFVLVGTLWECSLNIKNGFGIFLLILGVALEIYVLFFALNFKDTYVDDQFSLCNRGVYALCRHPGFYSFLLIYIGLYVMYQTETFFWILIVFNIYNFLYIVFQDTYVFPKLFKEYNQYKKTTPFLIFNKKSIFRCINDFRGIK